MTGNCFIGEAGAGKALITLTMDKERWLKICPSFEDALRLATQLKIIESLEGCITTSLYLNPARGFRCTVGDDYDTKALSDAGFARIAASY
jgi:hypothetical protein